MQPSSSRTSYARNSCHFFNLLRDSNMTANDHTTDLFMDQARTLAIEQQQRFYELVSDYMAFHPDEHKYLKQNIGNAIYGPPQQANFNNINATETNGGKNKRYRTKKLNVDANIIDIEDYDEKAKNVINIIYSKICEHAVENDCTKTIYISIIYNVIYKLAKEADEKKEEKDETTAEKDEVNEDVKLPLVIAIPIFKIWKTVLNKTEIELAKEMETDGSLTLSYEKSYLDIGGRVYKSWIDYLQNNKLPECIMVVPKDGWYQADPSYEVTENSSTVWLEFIDSPACALTERLCHTMDIVSNFVGASIIGLNIAALFTPLAPAVALTGLAATGVIGAWTIGRCSQQLADRSSHDESIDIRNKDAFAQWLGIASSAFGLGAIGRSVAIAVAAIRGTTMNTAARLAFNTVQSGNLLLNSIGIAYQSHYMIDNYREEHTFNYYSSARDALNLATHIMFFADSVVNAQFSKNIIESVEGRIINNYRDLLRTQCLYGKSNHIR